LGWPSLRLSPRSPGQGITFRPTCPPPSFPQPSHSPFSAPFRGPALVRPDFPSRHHLLLSIPVDLASLFSSRSVLLRREAPRPGACAHPPVPQYVQHGPGREAPTLQRSFFSAEVPPRVFPRAGPPPPLPLPGFEQPTWPPRPQPRAASAVSIFSPRHAAIISGKGFPRKPSLGPQHTPQNPFFRCVCSHKPGCFFASVQTPTRQRTAQHPRLSSSVPSGPKPPKSPPAGAPKTRAPRQQTIYVNVTLATPLPPSLCPFFPFGSHFSLPSHPFSLLHFPSCVFEKRRAAPQRGGIKLLPREPEGRQSEGAPRSPLGATPSAGAPVATTKKNLPPPASLKPLLPCCPPLPFSEPLALLHHLSGPTPPPPSPPATHPPAGGPGSKWFPPAERPPVPSPSGQPGCASEPNQPDQ